MTCEELAVVSFHTIRTDLIRPDLQSDFIFTRKRSNVTMMRVLPSFNTEMIFFPLSSFTWRRASVDGHGTSAPRKRSPRSRLPFQPWRLQPPSVIHVLQSSQLVLLRNGFMSAVLCLWKPDVCLWDGSEQQNNNTGWAESKHSHSCGCKCIHFEQCGGRLD